MFFLIFKIKLISGLPLSLIITDCLYILFSPSILTSLRFLRKDINIMVFSHATFNSRFQILCIYKWTLWIKAISEENHCYSRLIFPNTHSLASSRDPSNSSSTKTARNMSWFFRLGLTSNICYTKYLKIKGKASISEGNSSCGNLIGSWNKKITSIVSFRLFHSSKNSR